MSAATSAPDLHTAADVIETAAGLVRSGIRQLVAAGGPDANQVLAYDLAHASAQVETARALLDYGVKGTTEAAIACAFTADMLHDLISRIIGRESVWGVEMASIRDCGPFLAAYRAPEFLASLADQQGPHHLDDDMDMVGATFRSFAEKVIRPQAEHVHRHNADVPEEIITGLADMGAFGLSVPVEYGGGGADFGFDAIVYEELGFLDRREVTARLVVRPQRHVLRHLVDERGFVRIARRHPVRRAHQGRSADDEERNHRELDRDNDIVEAGGFLNADHQQGRDGGDDRHRRQIDDRTRGRPRARGRVIGQRGRDQLRRQMNAETAEHADEIARPADRHRGRADGVFQDQVPADDPGDQLAHRGVGVSVRAARNRNHRGLIHHDDVPIDLAESPPIHIEAVVGEAGHVLCSPESAEALTSRFSASYLKYACPAPTFLIVMFPLAS